MTYFTEEMMVRHNNYRSADFKRRLAKLRRLNPEAPPETNLLSASLDYVEGDPERLADFLPAELDQ